jgi:hypothetical protein
MRMRVCVDECLRPFAGPLARIGPNLLVTNDYEVVRRICAVRSRYVRDEWFVASRFDPPNDHVASTIDERRHSELRAKLSVGVGLLMYGNCGKRSGLTWGV